MRPRLLHLGYAIEDISKIKADIASMRPRLLHLGYFNQEVTMYEH